MLWFETIQWHTAYSVWCYQMELLIAWCSTSSVRFYLLQLHSFIRVNDIVCQKQIIDTRMSCRVWACPNAGTIRAMPQGARALKGARNRKVITFFSPLLFWKSSPGAICPRASSENAFHFVLNRRKCKVMCVSFHYDFMRCIGMKNRVLYSNSSSSSH